VEKQGLHASLHHHTNRSHSTFELLKRLAVKFKHHGGPLTNVIRGVLISNRIGQSMYCSLARIAPLRWIWGTLKSL